MMPKTMLVGDIGNTMTIATSMGLIFMKMYILGCKPLKNRKTY